MSKQGKHDVYLLVVDSSKEFQAALDYSIKMANDSDARIALLRVMQVEHVDHWQNIEEKIRSEMRAHSESLIWEASGRILRETEHFPMVCIEEGTKSDIIFEMIEQYPNISALVLGADSVLNKPGPLVTYFVGKGLSRLNVPLVIVPGHLQSV
ncbi:MAG: universal stress protein [Alphaproteobacteria bacterium]|nr:universal stress protein [Alphaproteobacteria bacterium]